MRSRGGRTALNSPRMQSAKWRQRKALALVLDGWSFTAIAKTLGYASESGARAAFEAALGTLPPALDRDQGRAVMVFRLDRLLHMLWPKLKDGDRVNLGVVDRILAVEARRAQVLGLDAPKGLDLSLGLAATDARTADAKIDAALDRALAEEEEAEARAKGR